MRYLGQTLVQFGTLLAFVASVSSFPASIRMSAEEFMNQDDVKVRRDGSILNQTESPNWICGPCTSYYHYTKVGNGNPHQNFVITQKGGTTLVCSSPSDSTTAGVAVTLGWSLSLGVNSAFSSAGFSISQSETTSAMNSFTCNGVAAEKGDICVLFYQAVTAFTVDVIEVVDCQCEGPITINRGNAVVYAPNVNQIGSIAGRGINVPQHGVEQCVGDANRRVNYYCGPYGGPEWWTGRGAGPWIAAYVNERQPAGCAIPIEANLYTD